MSLFAVSKTLTVRHYMEVCKRNGPNGPFADEDAKGLAVGVQLQLFSLWQEKVWRSKVSDSKIRACLAAFLGLQSLRAWGSSRSSLVIVVAVVNE